MKVLIDISEQKYKWICENPLVYDSDLEISVRKGIAIPENATNSVLDKIRAEITDWQTDIHDNEYDAETHDFVFERIYEILDKYKTESEDKNGRKIYN